jgi:hypothetical protein
VDDRYWMLKDIHVGYRAQDHWRQSGWVVCNGMGLELAGIGTGSEDDEISGE